MCCDAADPPAADPRQGEALIRQTQIGENMSNYMIAADQRNQGRLDQQQDQNNQMFNLQYDAAQKAGQRGDEAYNYYMNTGRPQIQRSFNDANNFDSEATLAGLRGKASADVEQAFAGQRDAASRALGRMGVNPSSGRALSAMGAGGANAALAKVGTANQMTEGRHLAAAGLRQQSANLASGFPAQSAQQTGLSGAAATSAAGLNAASMQSQLQAQQAFMGGMGSAGSQFGGVASGFGSMNNSRLNAWGMANQAQAQESAGWGQAAGTAAAAYLAFLA